MVVSINMYNTQFKVKYNDIKEELTYKLKSPEYKETSDEEYAYTIDDILDICDKLYRDELLSVFDAEDIMDDKVDNGLRYVYDIMMKNEPFKEIIDEMTRLYISDDVSLEQQETMKQIIIISLFSQQLFHIMHKCICQQFDTGEIDEPLLVELKTHSVANIKNHLA